ncbi:hypothetical protein G6F63_014802 [Rhizopus arrhizus]|nr:hypothetical protein G6F63_014802 [Rhizopus arrhizus]
MAPRSTSSTRWTSTSPSASPASRSSRLQGGNNTVLIVGGIAENHPQAAAIRAAARDFAAATGAKLCRIPQGANAVGLTRAGVLPAGKDVAAMLAQPRQAYVVRWSVPRWWPSASSPVSPPATSPM